MSDLIINPPPFGDNNPEPTRFKPKVQLERLKVFLQKFFEPEDIQPRTEDKLIIHANLIRQHVETADMLLAEMNVISASCFENDTEFKEYAGFVIESLRGGHRKLQQILQRKDCTPAERIRVIERYSDWLQRANFWIFLLDPHNHNSKEDIVQAAKQFIADESAEVIERDLQVIHKYKMHQVDWAIGIGADGEKLQQRLDGALERSLSSLTYLRMEADQTTLEKFDNWKKTVNVQREVHYNTALHLIDTLVPLILSGADEIYDIRIAQYYADLAKIEENLGILHDMMENPNVSRDAIKSHCHKLEVLRECLLGKFFIPNDISERLEAIREIISDALVKLDNRT